MLRKNSKTSTNVIAVSANKAYHDVQLEQPANGNQEEVASVSGK